MENILIKIQLINSIKAVSDSSQMYNMSAKIMMGILILSTFNTPVTSREYINMIFC